LFRPYGTRCLSQSPRHFHAGLSHVAALRLERRISLCAAQQRIHYYSGVRRSQQLRSLLLFTGLTGLLLGLSACYGGSRPPRIGSNAPDFTVQDAQNKVTLSAYRGKVVVLNFWATWCPPCIEEMPSLVEMQRRMKAKGVTVLAVSVDVDEGAYKQFVKDHNVNLVTARDPDQKSNSLYGTSKFPETYIIDRNGVVRRKFIGAVDWTAPEITDFLGKL
jgi:cytochrome c biogenesis protein CcmG, thiol:disulfide interchange protein DsbE